MGLRAPGQGLELPRLAFFAAAIAALLGFALPASALASSTNITSPASPYRVFYDNANPPAAPTVSGTATIPGPIDINCYYAPIPDYGPLAPAVLASNVTVHTGNFSTTISLNSSMYTIPCVMRAVPHGDTTDYAPGHSSSYTGPTMFFGNTYTQSAPGPRTKDFFAYPTDELGVLDITSPNENALYWSSVVDPTDLAQSPQFFAGVGALFSGAYSNADPGHSDVKIDDADASDPDSASGTGAPSEGYTHSFDPATGDLTLHETLPYVKCDDGPCSSYSSTGIELDRTWQVTHGDSVIAMTDVWRSTDGNQHHIALTYNEQIEVTTNRSSFLFPGSSAFVTHDAGDSFSLPGPGSILLKDDSTTPDSGGVYGQGAISYASAPDGPVRFIYGDDNFDSPDWVMPYDRTVPAGGSVTLRFSYEQNHAMPDVRSAAAAAEQSFKPAVSIASPADGFNSSASSVTVSGTASDAVQLASLAVNGAAVPVGADGSWSHALTLHPGANTITAVATNSDGGTAQSQITVNYVPPVAPPAVAHLSLAGGLHLLPSGVRFTLACTVARCSGQAALTTVERLRGKTPVGVSAAKSRKPKLRRKTVTVGRVRFTIDAGKKRTITVSLNRTGRKLLKRFHRLPARLRITLAQPGAKRVTVKNAKLVFKPAKKKHH